MATFVSRNDDGGSWHSLSRYSLPAAPHSDRKSRTSTARRQRLGRFPIFHVERGISEDEVCAEVLMLVLKESVAELDVS